MLIVLSIITSSISFCFFGVKMKKNKLTNLFALSNDELLLIDGGGLLEVTKWLLDGGSYAVVGIAA